MSKEQLSVYTPSPRITSFLDVERELQYLKTALDTLSTGVILKTSYEVPNKPVQYQMVYADGAKWNPGQGAGPYIYIGTTWRKVSIT